MIPQRLTLKNFLSYREATVDFRGLHTACICGPNGAGKSSLLEAIAWAIWGESRADVEDDVIHMGEAETQVDFVFISHDRTYRVIRSRYRKQATGLEFQVAIGSEAGEQGGGGAEGKEITLLAPPPSTFRSLTAKGIRATQQLILDHLKLDYDTFVNSAYLRQGRADEFMLKRSSERKQILADLLKLDRYDEMAERAKEESRQFKAQIDQQERHLGTIETQLQSQEQIAQDQIVLEAQLATLQQQQEADRDRLQVYQTHQQQRQTWQQQLTWQQQQQRVLAQDCQRLQQDSIAARKQHQELENLLRQQETIVTGFSRFQTLQAQETEFSARFKSYQTAQTQRQQYQQQQTEKLNQLQRQLQHTQTQIEALNQQAADLQPILAKGAEVETALDSLHQSRAQLTHLDQTQAQVAPLLQRRQQLQTQLDRAAARLTARLEELRASAHQLQSQRERQPKLQQAVVEISDRIETLEQRRAYQQSILDKGLERRTFMERLQAEQRECETNLAEVEQKIQLLKQELPSEAPAQLPAPQLQLVSTELTPTYPFKVAETHSTRLYSLPSAPLPSTPYPPCPLCDRPLDEHHWQVVLEKHQHQQQEFLSQIWVIREQLSASEREIQILRQEYRDIDKELGQYSTVLERRGQLQEQLQTTLNLQTSLRQVIAEVEVVEQALEAGNFAQELQEELQLLDRSLHQLHYDERNHALARGQVDRWRWAEIKHAEVKQSQRKQAQLRDRLPALHAQRKNLHAELEQRQQQIQSDLDAFDQHMDAIGYDLDQHNQLQAALRQAQPWQLRYQELYRAQQNYPRSLERIEELTQALQERQSHLHHAHAHVQSLTQQLEQLPDCQPQIQAIDQQMQQRRSRLDEHLAHLGRLQQQQQQLASLSTQHDRLSSQLQTARHRLRVYQELAQAFGKNGIQTLMIENVLPQLEAETNHILGRLSANQLHVQFITQKSNRRDQSKNASAAGKAARSAPQTSKLIETLDILIADTHGTRPYETYSGGEAFRVNFAIRLALSRLLAQRSGTALQLLVIDEGFGTQDQEGCDRLVAAINAIAPDFACILAVTHVPHLKEAFQSRIEVYKTENGSQVSMAASL